MAQKKPNKRRTPPKRRKFSIGGQLRPETFTALEALKKDLEAAGKGQA